MADGGGDPVDDEQKKDGHNVDPVATASTSSVKVEPKSGPPKKIAGYDEQKDSGHKDDSASTSIAKAKGQSGPPKIITIVKVETTLQELRAALKQQALVKTTSKNPMKIVSVNKMVPKGISKPPATRPVGPVQKQLGTESAQSSSKDPAKRIELHTQPSSALAKAQSSEQATEQQKLDSSSAQLPSATSQRFKKTGILYISIIKAFIHK